MRQLATLVVMAALMSPMTASGQNYTFGDWARDHGYLPGGVMPDYVPAFGPSSPAIDSLDGIGEFDWTTTPTTSLNLTENQISSIESGAFSGLTNLTELKLGHNNISSIESDDFSGLPNLTGLELYQNKISSIESGVFSGLPNLRRLMLGSNSKLTELNLAEADFSSLDSFDIGNSLNIDSVSLRNAVVNQTSLATLLDGHDVGIGRLPATITELDLSGIDFADITDLGPLYAMDDLTDLWLANTLNLDATGLDDLLDNLRTIQWASIEGILHLNQADFDALNTGSGLLAAWDAEPGHHVEYVDIHIPAGDMNEDGDVNGLDVDLFVEAVLSEPFNPRGDMNGDGVVTGLDVDPFVAAVLGSGGSTLQAIPEPSTLLLSLLALGVAGGWRMRQS